MQVVEKYPAFFYRIRTPKNILKNNCPNYCIIQIKALYLYWKQNRKQYEKGNHHHHH